MANPIKAFEEFFLKIFKVTVLIIMGISLLSTLLLSFYSIYQYSQSPKEPKPAQKAPDIDPVKEINLGEFTNYLVENEKQKKTPVVSTQIQQSNRQSAQFLEDATEMYRCASNFAQQIGVSTNETNDEFLKRIGQVRDDLEVKAMNPLRGGAWIKAVVAFSCKALDNDLIKSLAKEKKVSGVFYSVIEFHGNVWDKIQNKKMQFEIDEKNRVESERYAEGIRVASAKAKAITGLSAAAGFFGIFMLLAFYLIFSKIESNLRVIKDSIQLKNAPLVTKD